MTPVSLARILAAVALAAIVASGSSFDVRAIRAAAGEAAASQASRAPRDAEEFDALFQQVKNWERWGPDDQLGAANLITAATRKRAVALAKDGFTVSLAHNPLTDKADDNASTSIRSGRPI